jgi:hypothetical protein
MQFYGDLIRLPIRLVKEEELRRVVFENTTECNRYNMWTEMLRLPVEMKMDFTRLFVTVEEKREFTRFLRLVVRYNDTLIRELPVPREVIRTQFETLVTECGLLVIRAPLRRMNELEVRDFDRFDIREIRDINRRELCDRFELFNQKWNQTHIEKRVTETEEHRIVRKWLRTVERNTCPQMVRTCIEKCRDTNKSVVKFWIDTRHFNREEIKVTCEEPKNLIRVEARRERKNNEIGNFTHELRFELINIPKQFLEIKNLRTVVREDGKILIVVPTIIDLLPEIRINEEVLDVKRL